MGVFTGVQYELTYEDRIKGGKSTSLKKVSASKVNALQHGKRAKDPKVVEIVTQTAEEKILGIEPSEKIKQLKKLNPLFGSNDRIEYLLGVKEFIGELLISALKKKKTGKSTDSEYRQLTKLTLELYDRLFGKPSTMIVNQQNNTQTILLQKLHQSILDLQEEEAV